MQLAYFLAIAGLAAANPLAARTDHSAPGPGVFKVTDFKYGCITPDECDWSFDLAVTNKERNHPKVKKPAQ